MTFKNVITTLFSALIGVWSAAYVSSAAWHVKQTFLPRQDIGFGPHIMPWPEALLMATKGAFGLLLAVLLLTRSVQWFRRLALGVVSLLVINVYNAYTISRWIPESRHVGVSVFAFFSPVLLVEYAIAMLALLVGAITFATHARRGRQVS